MLWVALAAILIIGGGGVLLITRHKKGRAAGTALGALALVGALTFLPVINAPSAQASENCDPPSTSQPTDPVVVTTTAPTYTESCGAEPVVTLPTTEGVTYTETREGNTLTVTANANDGYVLATGATTTWDYDMSYIPVTILTSNDIAFTYTATPSVSALNGLTLTDTATADYLRDAGATITVYNTVAIPVVVRITQDEVLIDEVPLGLPGWQNYTGTLDSAPDVTLTETSSEAWDAPNYQEKLNLAYAEYAGIPYPLDPAIGVELYDLGMEPAAGTTEMTVTYTDECATEHTLTATNTYSPTLAIPSDQRLKTDISLVGTTDDGINLYAFRYIDGDDTVYVGVMAQEILETHPEAVITRDDGYYAVNYAMLGLQMQTLDEYLNR